MLENICVLLAKSFQRLKPERHNYIDVDNVENLVKGSVIL